GYASTGTQVQGGGGGGRGGANAANITVNGPFDPAGPPVESPSRARIFVCRPTDPREESACASRIMSNIATKAFRRPVTADDMAPILKFYEDRRKSGGTFEDGIDNATIALLSSAKFLYRIEAPPANAKPGTSYRLSNIELASRLSFFLWSSVPDD